MGRAAVVALAGLALVGLPAPGAQAASEYRSTGPAGQLAVEPGQPGSPDQPGGAGQPGGSSATQEFVAPGQPLSHWPTPPDPPRLPEPREPRGPWEAPGAYDRPGVSEGPGIPSPGVPDRPGLANGHPLRVQLTGYSWQDNTPPYSDIISRPVLHRGADGQGTYGDPITVAVPGTRENPSWPPGTRFYLPSIQRYVIVEDTGASPSKAAAHLDVWIDGRDGSRAATDECMRRLTGTVVAELNPPPGRPVIPGPIFAGGSCRIPYLTESPVLNW